MCLCGYVLLCLESNKHIRIRLYVYRPDSGALVWSLLIQMPLCNHLIIISCFEIEKWSHEGTRIWFTVTRAGWAEANFLRVGKKNGILQNFEKFWNFYYINPKRLHGCCCENWIGLLLNNRLHYDQKRLEKVQKLFFG